MNYPPNQPPMQSNYPPQLPPDRNIPPNMINPQFKNYNMQQMMMKSQPQQRPPSHPAFHQGNQPPPQYLPQQMPPSQMNPSMNPHMNHMMMPNMMNQPQGLHPASQGIPQQMPMNPSGYPLQMRRPTSIENPQIKMEQPYENLMGMTQSLKKKTPPIGATPMNPNIATNMMHNPIQNNAPQITPMSPAGNGNASPTSNSQNQMLSSNTKEHAKSKPSELNALGLKINNHNISGYDIVTKIFFGKKQIVWELVESGTANEKKDTQIKIENKEKEDEEKNNEKHEDANSSKKKFDIKFSDIESIEVNVEKNTMTIGFS